MGFKLSKKKEYVGYGITIEDAENEVIRQLRSEGFIPKKGRVEYFNCSSPVPYLRLKRGGIKVLELSESSWDLEDKLYKCTLVSPHRSKNL